MDSNIMEIVGLLYTTRGLHDENVPAESVARIRRRRDSMRLQETSFRSSLKSNMSTWWIPVQPGTTEYGRARLIAFLARASLADHTHYSIHRVSINLGRHGEFLIHRLIAAWRVIGYTLFGGPFIAWSWLINTFSVGNELSRILFA